VACVAVHVYRDSDGASANVSDSSDSDDRNLRRKRDVTTSAKTSRPTASGPQGGTQTGVVRSMTEKVVRARQTADDTHGEVML